MKCLCLIADVDVDKPDEKSIMTYVAQFLKHYPNPNQSEPDGYHDEVFFQIKQTVYGDGDGSFESNTNVTVIGAG